ncbi:MAG: hypothetical protein D3909_07730 [Candidatus Electrothrix sp. ATG1]|nr:hypothetical protein [Candidatus Electrothrix sp. ATG1]
MYDDSNVNCWEFKKCGRETGGRNLSVFGICSVPVEFGFDGVNDGKNGGRSCWIIRESACEQVMRQCCVQEIRECRQCEFFTSVLKSKVKLVWTNKF